MFTAKKMSLNRNSSLKKLMKRKDCKSCKILSVVKSDKAIKSPPVEKLKTDRFHERWFTLSIMDLCSSCSPPAGKRGLMLSYYEDNSEKHLKGRFEVDKSELIPVDSLPEGAPSKYKKCKHVLKWELPHDARTLYMIVENETEQIAWIHAFEALIMMLKPTEDGLNGDNDDKNEGAVTITDTRLQQELVELRNSYQDDEGENYLSATNVFADEYVEEEKFNAQHSFTIRGNRNSPHDSGISSASETSWRTSNMSSYSYSRTDSSSIVNSRYSQSPMETASNTMRLSEDCEEAIYGNNTQC